MNPARGLALAVTASITIILFGFCAHASEEDSLWQQHIPCGGVDRAPHVALKSGDYYAQDLGVLAVRVSTSYPREHFDYVVELLERILPSMIEVVGAPASYETLSVELAATDLVYYRCGSHTIEMYPLPADGPSIMSRAWDNTFIHELVHAFQRDVICGDDYPSWVEEGMAEAGCYFVSELATQRSEGRDFRFTRFDRQMAAYDLDNSAGSQIIGGCWSLIDRVDSDMAYQNAGSTILVPALAEIGAGRVVPHPLARLTEALRQELHRDLPRRLFRAIDRAWTTPVDGTFPPSRWVRSRAVTCTSARNGELLAILPTCCSSGVNARAIRTLYFQRLSGMCVRLTSTGPACYTGVRGDTYVSQATYGWHYTPTGIAPGAYLVEADEPVDDGGSLSARTWILALSPFWPQDTLWNGVAAVFVDGKGRPIDVADLSVNGEILARVPGGAIVKPYSSRGGDLVFRGFGREIGTVTVPGGLPRMVVLWVDQAPHDVPAGGVVSWWPYSPRVGDTCEVALRPSESSLHSSETRISAVLKDEVGAVMDSARMDDGGSPGLLRALLSVPEDLTCGMLEFIGEESSHRTCPRYAEAILAGYDFEVRPPDGYELSKVCVEGSDLVLGLDTSIDPSRLRLRLADEAGGPWTERGNPQQDWTLPATYRWNLSDVTEAFYFEVVVNDDDEEILCTGFIDAVPRFSVTAVHPPFPNPSPGPVRLRVDVAAPTDDGVSFDVFDATGRLVHSQSIGALAAGPQELWWDGWTGGQRVPAGVYFLRIHGHGINHAAKAILVH